MWGKFCLLKWLSKAVFGITNVSCGKNILIFERWNPYSDSNSVNLFAEHLPHRDQRLPQQVQHRPQPHQQHQQWSHHCRHVLADENQIRVKKLQFSICICSTLQIVSACANFTEIASTPLSWNILGGSPTVLGEFPHMVSVASSYLKLFINQPWSNFNIINKICFLSILIGCTWIH